MFKLISVMIIALVSVSSHAASRYFYDLQKFEAVLKSKAVEAKLGTSTLDGIEKVGLDEAQRTITYLAKTGNGKCSAKVVVSWDEGMDPNYHVTSVSEVTCIGDLPLIVPKVKSQKDFMSTFSNPAILSAFGGGSCYNFKNCSGASYHVDEINQCLPTYESFQYDSGDCVNL